MKAKIFALRNHNVVTLRRRYRIEDLCRTGTHSLTGERCSICEPPESGPGGRWGCERCGRPTRGVSSQLEEHGTGDLCDTCWVEREFDLGMASPSFDRGDLSQPDRPYDHLPRPRRVEVPNPQVDVR